MTALQPTQRVSVARLVVLSLLVFSALSSAAAVVTPPSLAATVSPRPCDIYARGGTPCVAAYSTTRTLYDTYRGPLYTVQRVSDQRTLRVRASANGFANVSFQKVFCANSRCIVTKLFDQSLNHNNLTIAGPGGDGGQDAGVVANELPVKVGGHSVYGMSFDGGMGYRDNRTAGVATGAEPQTEYLVASGTHANDLCCFDFGNAETSARDTGNGHMDAIYFGSECWYQWPVCYGKGPWVQADLENGVFMSDTGASQDMSDTGDRDPFVTAMLRNNGVDRFAIESADAQAGSLDTDWAGPLPTSRLGDPPETTIPYAPFGPGPTTFGPALTNYSPMHQEGAVILGTGGDNTHLGIGSFFEGAITRGYASEATQKAVQANIVAARYRPRTSPLPSRDRWDRDQ